MRYDLLSLSLSVDSVLAVSNATAFGLVETCCVTQVAGQVVFLVMASSNSRGSTCRRRAGVSRHRGWDRSSEPLHRASPRVIAIAVNRGRRTGAISGS
jgi:hypothetical protein